MNAITYRRDNRKRVAAYLSGAFLCFLDHKQRTTTGLHRVRIDWWECRIAGHELAAPTLGALKAKIAAHLSRHHQSAA